MCPIFRCMKALTPRSQKFQAHCITLWLWKVSQQYVCLTLKPLHANHKLSPIHSCEERVGAHRGTKVAPWYKHCSCGWWKGTSWDEAMMIREEIKSLAPSYACLKALVSKQVSKASKQASKVSKSDRKMHCIRNFITIWWKSLGLIWRHFWAWLYLTNPLKLSESKYKDGFWDDNLGSKSPTLHDPYM